MKTFVIIILLLISNFCFSQIGEVKTDGTYLRIYNETGTYTSSIYVGSNILKGYNNKFIVVIEGRYAKIYNDKGNYTGSSIYLGSSEVKHVTGTNILIQEGHYIKYYNFKGNYTGNSTLQN